MQLTIALAGEEAAGVQALRLLAHRGHKVVAVFTDSRAGGSSASVASTAESLGVPVHAASELLQPALAGWLREQQVELLLNVHSRPMPHADVLEAPTLGAYNVHPGPLPECAGFDGPSWAVYEGADRHGVTVHRMTPVYDAGPIAFIDTFDIGANDTGLTVLRQCVRRGLRLVEQLLDLAERGEPIPADPQDLTRRRWFGDRPPEEGRIDWNGSARRVVDFVRACNYLPFRSPWGFPRCMAGGVDIEILDARVVPWQADVVPGTVTHAGDGAVLIAAADAWVRVEHVEVDGERLVAVDVIRDGERMEQSREGLGRIEAKAAK
jgi:methionyl-tRNA formyltransferase